MNNVIQNLIDEALVQEPHEGSGKIIASSLGRCYRMQYWQRKNEPQTDPPDKRTLRVFYAGDLFHKFVQDLLIKKGYKAEVKYEDDEIKFRADLLKTIDGKEATLTSSVCNEAEVIDLKSQHSQAFWYYKQADFNVRQDKYNNWLQVMVECKYLNRKQGRIAFISKDDLCIAEFVEPYNAFWQRELEQELKTLREIWDKQELPPPIQRCYIGKNGKSKECSYCSYKTKCKEHEKNK